MHHRLLPLIVWLLVATDASAAFVEKYVLDGGIPESNRSGPQILQLDEDPALEIITAGSSSSVQIRDGATGEIEYQKQFNLGSSVVSGVRAAVLDLDADGLLEVVLTLLGYAQNNPGPEMALGTVVVDTDASVSMIDDGYGAVAPDTGIRMGSVVPEPARADVDIDFVLDRPLTVSVRILDVSGRLVKEVTPGLSLEDGPHRVTWDGRDEHGGDAPGGVYFVRVATSDFADSRRITLVR